MATQTENLGLRKPAPEDLVNVTTDISDNMDLLDAAIEGRADANHSHEGGEAEGAVETHRADTTNVHGIVDTSALALNDHNHSGVYAPAAAIGTHNADTLDVHGIPDTSLLVDNADLVAHNEDTTAVHGIANTALLITTATHALIDHDDIPGSTSIPVQDDPPASPDLHDLWVDSDEPAVSGGGGGAAIAYQPEAPDSPSEGDLWADSDETTPTPSGSTGLLAVVKYDPLAFTTKTATTSVVNLDTTNLIASFTVPASGKVLVRLTALVDGAGGNYYWVVRNAADTELGRSIVVGGASSYQQMSIPVYLTGLTPGALTIRWAHTESAGSNTVNYGQATTGWIPAVIEVWAAP